MRKIFYMVMALAVGTMAGCKNEKKVAEENAESKEAVEAKDSVVATAAETEGAQIEDDVEPLVVEGLFNPEEVRKDWSKSIVSVPGEKNDVVALFEAFYMRWPTIEGSRIVKETNPALAPKHDYYEEGCVIDRKNGYVESAWYEGEPLGLVSACSWKRNNGHKLFAVSFHMGKISKSFACFYDFDPEKRTLTPEESPVKKEDLKSPDKDPLFYDLPHEGKTMTVTEQGVGNHVIVIYYDFDGQNLKFTKRDEV